jgi:hypothetical protein
MRVRVVSRSGVDGTERRTQQPQQEADPWLRRAWVDVMQSGQCGCVSQSQGRWGKHEVGGTLQLVPGTPPARAGD